MPTLHVVVSKDLKRWLERRAKKEEVHGSVSRYCARVFMDFRANIERMETAPEPPITTEERSS
jgi:hypothetical protein